MFDNPKIDTLMDEPTIKHIFSKFKINYDKEKIAQLLLMQKEEKLKFESDSGIDYIPTIYIFPYFYPSKHIISQIYTESKTDMSFLDLLLQKRILIPNLLFGDTEGRSIRQNLLVQKVNFCSECNLTEFYMSSVDTLSMYLNQKINDIEKINKLFNKIIHAKSFNGLDSDLTAAERDALTAAICHTHMVESQSQYFRSMSVRSYHRHILGHTSEQVVKTCLNIRPVDITILEREDRVNLSEKIQAIFPSISWL